MSEARIREYATKRGFHPQTIDRWIGWEDAAQERLGDLAIALKLSENHVRDMMDWLEEISLRDNAKIQDILARPEIDSIATHPRLGRADKLKRIKEQLRRWRFPRLAAMEDSLAEHIRALRLPPGIRLSAPAGLEGGWLKAEFQAATPVELRKLSEALSEAAASKPMLQVFATLAGHPTEEKESER